MKGTWHKVYESTLGKGVAIANEQDDHYSCLFETREELDEFIAELNKLADEVWPQTK